MCRSPEESPPASANRAARQRVTQLVRVAVESIGKEKQSTGIGLLGKLFRELGAGLAPALGIAGHPARFRLEITRQQTDHHRVWMQTVPAQTNRAAETDHGRIAEQAGYATDNFTRLVLMRRNDKGESQATRTQAC